MNNPPFITLIFLSLLVSSCATTPDFSVMLEDASTGAPISGAKVSRYTLHFTGVNKAEEERIALGETNHQGVFRVGKLNVDSRNHSVIFVKEGYTIMNLVVVHRSEQTWGIIVKIPSNEHIGDPVIIAEYMVIKIPMWRK